MPHHGSGLGSRPGSITKVCLLFKFYFKDFKHFDDARVFCLTEELWGGVFLKNKKIFKFNIAVIALLHSLQKFVVF